MVPEIESSKVKKSLTEPVYGVLWSSAVIDETVNTFEELVDEIIRAAEIETTMKRLLSEIESTKRRVNALRVQGYSGTQGNFCIHQNAAPRNGTGRKRLPEEDQSEE